MGKKYIVEIGRLERLYKASISAKGMPNMTWLSPEVDLTPYTEPDLEQVRKEAYEEGKKQAKVQAELDVCHDIEKVAKENYKAGLSDAWEAARTIVKMSWEDKNKIFGKMLLHSNIFLDYTADEAIEKIRQYEQEQEKKEKHHTWICSEAGEPSTDITLICSKCGYAITLKLGDTQALNFCPKCGDNKRGERDE